MTNLKPASANSAVVTPWYIVGTATSGTPPRNAMGRRRHPPSQTWRTFLPNHIGQIVAADFFVVPTVTYRLLFVPVLIAHDRRRIRHIEVTAHPTAAWTAQQLREAFPWDEALRYLIHDRDHAFGRLGPTTKAMDIEEVPISRRSRPLRFFRPFCRPAQEQRPRRLRLRRPQLN